MVRVGRQYLFISERTEDDHFIMIGLGTIINTAGIVLGGVSGHFFGRLLKERHQSSFVGEIINIEGLFERFGEWLKIKTGNAKDKDFVNAFVSASLTVCIGAMAIVGAIQDGIRGDWSILATKAVLDFVIIMVMTCSLGKGCGFSAIPVLVFEGLITVFAAFLKPIMTDLAMNYLSLIGSILIFCVGLNLVWGKKVRVANMLPAVILAVVAAYIPF